MSPSTNTGKWVGNQKYRNVMNIKKMLSLAAIAAFVIGPAFAGSSNVSDGAGVGYSSTEVYVSGTVMSSVTSTCTYYLVPPSQSSYGAAYVYEGPLGSYSVQGGGSAGGPSGQVSAGSYTVEEDCIAFSGTSTASVTLSW